MSWPPVNISDVAAVLTIVLTFAIVPMAKWIHKIRKNDLEHIGQDVQDVKDRLQRIEAKLDEHIQYHLRHTHA